MEDKGQYCPAIEVMINDSYNSSQINYLFVSIHGILSVFGILENALIVWVIGFRVRRSVVSIWILNLAASDLIATVSLPFFTVFMAQGQSWPLGRVFCKIHSSIFFLNMYVSGFLLSAVSLDRCILVVYPAWSQNHRNVQLASRVCFIIWALAIINIIPFFIFRDTINRRDGRIMCYYNYILYSSPDDSLDFLCRLRHCMLAFIKFIVSFFIPLLVIIGSYTIVSLNIRKRGRKPTSRFFRLIVCVIISFVLFWLPYHIFSILEAFLPYSSKLYKVVERILQLVSTLTFMNCIINPFLYVFSCPDFTAKIRQSLSTVMETVLMDEPELYQRRSTTHSSISSSDVFTRSYKFHWKKSRNSGKFTQGGAEPPVVF
ncbi:prostaglandin D2 receptor 2-like [Polypterus senegalus]|uniref:prostaglandin D2 receptor 2-like n=1 Tax=Polypterus senegalus TaxID=55291 RepID=UPI0019633B34|nr:prostaglandin D2 receptor 2-like [Polypterus senegalus]XP_039602812.1 prostaglandin D2 receptor 2-like [Polypterus senegalus]XP_039602813.1 prostaglandin D2 receptor 2-like [Polypterus senegalus]XP_039602814.1 prostaglandin D2 receptor 2-like [Polypterus senegalus]XP_039602815.1 prostaglandin D2 receptor 2-like [Polypterus senegalus]XP_039602816.1 prostaglandin D2 receptor 2-like [Polypterus senegalus]XP_039602817.1 prostaglandin D2 receptor 2-like [Polypterus senegalus]